MKATRRVFPRISRPDFQWTVGKKMAAVHFTTMPCEPNTAYEALRKPNYLQYFSLY